MPYEEKEKNGRTSDVAGLKIKIDSFVASLLDFSTSFVVVLF